MNNFEAQSRYDELELERNELIFEQDEMKNHENAYSNEDCIVEIDIKISSLEEAMDMCKEIIRLNDEIKKVRAENEEMEKGLINLKR